VSVCTMNYSSELLTTNCMEIQNTQYTKYKPVKYVNIQNWKAFWLSFAKWNLSFFLQILKFLFWVWKKDILL